MSVLATDQPNLTSALNITAASGSIASGAIASGAIASGAIASGAIAAGAIASGAAVSGAFADGSLVTLGAKADAKSTATDTTAVTIMQVLKEISFMAQTPAALPANQSVNVAQINGVTPLMGNGTTGTGSQRVTIASDNTAFAVNATLSAETTKVIGTVRDVGNVGGVFDAATAATVPANAIQQGARAATAYPTAVTDGQLVGEMADKAGRLVTVLNTPRDLVGTVLSVTTLPHQVLVLLVPGGRSVSRYHYFRCYESKHYSYCGNTYRWHDIIHLCVGRLMEES